MKETDEVDGEPDEASPHLSQFVNHINGLFVILTILSVVGFLKVLIEALKNEMRCCSFLPDYSNWFENNEYILLLLFNLDGLNNDRNKNKAWNFCSENFMMI